MRIFHKRVYFFVKSIMRSSITNVFKVIRYLSIDVVIGGIVISNAIAKVFDHIISIHSDIALASCIWLIYTLDHLVDAHKVIGEPSMERHIFHKKYKKVIIMVFILVVIMGLIQLPSLPFFTLMYGGKLIVIVALYFLVIWMFKMFFMKEFLVAIVYAAGVSLSTVSLVEQLTFSLCLICIQTGLLAVINLLIFSLFEISTDKQDDTQSWAVHFGIKKTTNHIRILFTVFFLSLLVGLFTANSGSLFFFQVVTFAMASVLFIVFTLDDTFRQNNRFRWVGDLVFLFPAILFLI